MEVGQLTVLPAAHTEQEAHHIGLLLAPQLLHIPIRSHVDLSKERKKTTNNSILNIASLGDVQHNAINKHGMHQDNKHPAYILHVILKRSIIDQNHI